jgi:hypothetical protein
VGVPGDLDGRVVDQDVDAAVLVVDVGEHALDLAGLGHLADHDRLVACRRRTSASCTSHAVLDRLARLLGAFGAA